MTPRTSSYFSADSQDESRTHNRSTTSGFEVVLMACLSKKGIWCLFSLDETHHFRHQATTKIGRNLAIADGHFNLLQRCVWVNILALSPLRAQSYIRKTIGFLKSFVSVICLDWGGPNIPIPNSKSHQYLRIFTHYKMDNWWLTTVWKCQGYRP